MKKIKLASVKIASNTQIEDVELSYRKEFLRAVEVATEGLTVSQMGTAIKVARKLQNTAEGADVYLEDAEHEYLLSKVRAVRFSFVASELVDMVESVEKAQTCEAPHLVSGASAD